MATISLRVSRQLRDTLMTKARDSGMSLSEYVRTILSNAATYNDDDWLLMGWRIFGVNMSKLRNALSKSLSVADFFSRVDTLSKISTIMPNVSENLDFDFTIKDKEYNVSVEPTGNIAYDAEAIVRKLDKRILDSFMEEL